MLTLLLVLLGTALAASPQPGFQAAGLALAGDTSCAWSTEGEVRCWGRGVGQDVGYDRMSATPVVLPSLQGAQELALQWTTACARLADGSVRCQPLHQDVEAWTVEDLDDAVQIEAAGDGFCAVRATGQVRCWGSLYWAFDKHEERKARPIPGSEGVTRLSCETRNCCGERASGPPLCFGEGDQDRGLPKSRRAVPTELGGTLLALDHQALYVRDTAGQLKASGYYGADPSELVEGPEAQLVASSSTLCGWDPGGGPLRCRDWSGEVRTVGADVVEVDLGNNHACARKADGSVLCWGANEQGQTGDGLDLVSPEPAPVAGLPPVVELSAGWHGTCARTAEGVVHCWGNGSGSPKRRGSSVEWLAPGQYLSGCWKEAGGGVSCAYLEDAQEDRWRRYLRTHASWEDEPGISAGHEVVAFTSDRGINACAAVKGGSVYCSFTLGEGGQDDRWREVEGSAGVVELVSASLGWCGRKADGSVVCWQDPRFEGDPDFVGVPKRPRARPAPELGKAAVSLAAHQNGACALQADGRVLCQAGMGFGGEFLGQGEVAVLQGVDQLASKHFHACALREGRVACLGDGSEGQLGPSSTGEDSDQLVDVGLPEAAVDLSVGEDFSCAVGESGTVWCWGSDEEGQLGRGRQPWREEAVRVGF